MSFDYARQIMEIELDPDHKHFARMLSAKQSVASSMMTASVRIDASGLRKQTNDRLGELLDLVKKERADRNQPVK